MVRAERDNERPEGEVAPPELASAYCERDAVRGAADEPWSWAFAAASTGRFRAVDPGSVDPVGVRRRVALVARC